MQKINSNHNISVIIPVYNEASFILRLLDQLEGLNFFSEIIIVDGNSKDGTQKLAERSLGKLVASEVTQRSFQCNLGAKMANGDYLLFLHADISLPLNFKEAINKALEEGIQLANFTLKFDKNHWFLSLNAFFSRFKSSYFQFGDQGLLIKRSLFEENGGYSEGIDLAEGNDLIRRARKHASFKKLNSTLTVSARKYHKHGVFKLQFVYYLVYLMIRIGVSQARIKKSFNALLN